jgi:YesN/AraC family two-component response regulator
LGHIFKKATGFSVNEYIINCRIIKARELLKENLPVSKTGEMVGYCNVSHFIRTFSKLTGLSPKQYAKHRQ